MVVFPLDFYHVDIKRWEISAGQKAKTGLRSQTRLMSQGAVFAVPSFPVYWIESMAELHTQTVQNLKLEAFFHWSAPCDHRCWVLSCSQHECDLGFDLPDSHLFFCGNSLFWVKRLLDVLSVLDWWALSGSLSGDLPGFFCWRFFSQVRLWNTSDQTSGYTARLSISGVTLKSSGFSE